MDDKEGQEVDGYWTEDWDKPTRKKYWWDDPKNIWKKWDGNKVVGQILYSGTITVKNPAYYKMIVGMDLAESQQIAPVPDPLDGNKSPK